MNCGYEYTTEHNLRALVKNTLEHRRTPKMKKEKQKQSTKHRPKSTEHKIQNTEYKNRTSNNRLQKYTVESFAFWKLRVPD